MKRQDLVAILKDVERSEQRIDDLLDDRIRQALDEFPSCHPFMGAVVRGTVPTIILEATKDLPPRDSARLTLFPCAWVDTVLGESLTLTLSGSRGHLSQCWIYRDDASLEDLERGVLNVIFAKHKHPVRTVRLDYNVTPLVASVWRDTVNLLRQRSPSLLDDPSGHYWEVLAELNVPLSRRDRLQTGWTGVYCSAVQQLARVLALAKDVPLPAQCDVTRLPTDLGRFLELARSGASALAELIDLLSRRQLEGTLPGFLNDYLVGVGDHDPAAELREVFFLANKCAALSTRVTQCGTRVLGDERPESRRVPFMELDADRLPVASEEYWPRIETLFNWPWGDVLTIADIPIRREEIAEGWSDFSTDGGIDDLREAARTLIREAVTCKKWTIPPQAIVQLPIGPFRTVELTEIADMVHFVFRNERNECLWGKVQVPIVVSPLPPLDGWTLSLPSETPARLETESGLRLLIASIIRDFWVVEDRDTVFATTREPNGPRVQSRQPQEARVVYIPRIKYNRRPDTERCTKELGHRERSAHWVVAHLRRSDAASQAALILAKRYGVEVPTGHTFVRPHERGRTKRDVVYRSRSALRCLYVERKVATSSGSARWFVFERDVHNALKRMGFTVDHVAASRNGDKGIDLIARKGEGLDEVAWVIQAKCWRKKVGPDVIRELAGTLTSQPRGTRGMVVTTSILTPAAKETAHAVDIQFMEGEELAKLLAASRPR